MICGVCSTPGKPIFDNPGVIGADISATAAWDTTTGSRANVVAVIDTGIDYNHPDLAANIWTAPRAFSVTIDGITITCAAGTHGFNAITNTCNPMDDQSHGTHVAGTIGAVGNNGIGVAGVNWVASMMAIKFLDAAGFGSTTDAIKAIEFAIQAKSALGADANVRILSNSWGGYGEFGRARGSNPGGEQCRHAGCRRGRQFRIRITTWTGFTRRRSVGQRHQRRVDDERRYAGVQFKLRRRLSASRRAGRGGLVDRAE